MYNSETPLRAELPSSRQLLRSTVIAAISAVVLLTTVVLPSEYGVDPTGVGRMLGLTEMGAIKTRLAAEAAADAASTSATSASPIATASTQSTPTAPVPVQVPPAAEKATAWRDEVRFTLTPGQGVEIKLTMREGEKAEYAWVVQGGVVNFDTHGDALGRSISYEKGRAVSADEGELVAAFSGNHGWFWRNRGQADVTVVLQTRGQYSEVKRVL